MYTPTRAAVLTVTNRNVFCLRFTASSLNGCALSRLHSLRSSLELDRREAHYRAVTDLDRQGSRLCFFMPDLQGVLSWWDVRQNKFPVLIRLCEVRRLGHDHVGGHLRVYVAKHRPHTRSIEDVVFRRV